MSRAFPPHSRLVPALVLILTIGLASHTVRAETRQSEASEPPPGVRHIAGILVFDNQRTFDGILKDLRAAAGPRAGVDSDDILATFEDSLGFFSMRAYLADLEIGKIERPLSPTIDVDRYWLVDDFVAALLSPRREIIIGTTGYVAEKDVTFEFPRIDAEQLARLRDTDYSTADNVTMHLKTGHGAPPCEQGQLTCSNITEYDSNKRFKSDSSIVDFTFTSSMVVKTRHQKKSLGIWWRDKVDEIWALGEADLLDAQCENPIGAFNFGETDFDSRKADETVTVTGHAEELISDHGIRDGSFECTRTLDLFHCDTATTGCEDTSPPSTGLHIRTKFSEPGGTWSQGFANPGDGSGVHTYRTLTGDVDNDGEMDLVFVGQGWSGGGLNIRTKRSNGDGSWTSWSDVHGDGAGIHAYPTLTGDLNLDGMMDLIFVGQNWSGTGLNIRGKCSNGDGTWSSCWNQVTGDGSGVHTYPPIAGDVDNDGRTDLIFVGQNWSGPGLNVRIKRANPGGTWTSWSQVLGDGSGVHQHPTLTGDLNLDGNLDLIFVGQGWSGGGLNIRGKCSNGDGTWSSCWNQVTGDGSGVHTYPTLTGDVDNDGRTDLIFVGQNWSGGGLNVRVKRANPGGTWTSWSQVLGDGPGVHAHRALVGDLNQDSRTDLIFVGQGWSGGGLNIRGKCSNGNGTWSSCWNQVMGDGAGVHTYPALVGRVDDGNSTDLVFIGQNW